MTTASYSLGYPWQPGALTSLNLSVNPGDSDSIFTSWIGDQITVNDNGGQVQIGSATHMYSLATVQVHNGGTTSFAAAPMTQWNNDGTSTADSGGSLIVPINVIGQGLLQANTGGKMLFLAGVGSGQDLQINGGQATIDSLANFFAPIQIGTTGSFSVVNSGADSASWSAGFADFFSAGNLVAQLAVTALAPGGTIKIAQGSAPGDFTLTDPVPKPAPSHHHWA